LIRARFAFFDSDAGDGTGAASDEPNWDVFVHVLSGSMLCKYFFYRYHLQVSSVCPTTVYFFRKQPTIFWHFLQNIFQIITSATDILNFSHSPLRLELQVDAAAVAASPMMNWKISWKKLAWKRRPVFNFAARGDPRGEVGPQGWNLPPGVKLAPRGEVGPQGWRWPLGVKLAPRGELLPLGVKLYLMGKDPLLSHRGLSSPLRANFTP
jgi:hypothetical protein